MAKKPVLKVVPATPPNPTDPPANLGQHGAALWKTVLSEYDLPDCGGQEMLRQACAALDRAESCADHIREHGEMIATRTGARENPLLKHELSSRAFVVRTLHRLGLDVEPVRPMGRPSGFSA